MDRSRTPQLRRVTLLSALAAVLVMFAPASGASAATVWTVTRADDPSPGNTCAPGNCSLRQAIAQADPAAGDSVSVPASATPYTLSAAKGRIVVSKSLSIAGAGARTTTISGGGMTAVFSITAGTVNISGVKVTGGMDTSATAGGAGFYVDSATLNLTEVAVTGNTAAASNGNSIGAGISMSSATVNLTRSLVSGNTAKTSTSNAAAFGGGIAQGGTLTVVDSTVSGNTALSTQGSAYGGGLSSASGSSLTVRNATIAGNTASGAGNGDSGGNLIVNTSSGGSAKLQNTIVAGGTAFQHPNCDVSAGAITTLGGNLDTLNECGLGSNELRSTDPVLDSLGDHGGPTDTFAIKPGSPALRATGGCAALDQRGLPHPAACSIGAYEPQPPTITAGATPAQAAPGETLSFTATAADADPGDQAAISWRFDDGDTATGASATHAFATSGTHAAVATATDAYGLTGEATASVDVVTPAPPGPGPMLDTAAPTITRLSLTPPLFRAARKGATLASRKRVPVGTRLGYTLSEPATTTITVERRAVGRRSAKGCVRTTPGNRRARKCTRTVRVPGSVVRQDAAGRTRVRFSGRLRRRALRAGRYRVVVRARDAAGNESAAVRRNFKIVR
jgi:hypothetical protein